MMTKNFFNQNEQTIKKLSKKQKLILASFFFILVLSTVDSKFFLLMTGFKPQTPDIGSDPSANLATTTAPKNTFFAKLYETGLVVAITQAPPEGGFFKENPSTQKCQIQKDKDPTIRR